MLPIHWAQVTATYKRKLVGLARAPRHSIRQQKNAAISTMTLVTYAKCRAVVSYNLKSVHNIAARFYQLPTDEVAFSNHVNPMCEVFPRVASCTYWKYGTGGQQVGLQALCILSLNIVIDKAR
jgi:hypothetical protein